MTFEHWLQTRLNAHGARLSVDGDIGRATIAALKAFQEFHGLRETGIADAATIKALRAAPTTVNDGLIIKGNPSPAPPAATLPPWMYELVRRMGLHEARDKAELTEFLKLGKFLGDPAKLPWCGDAVESAFAKTLPDERLPSAPFFAQNWAGFGKKVEPMVGAVGVIRWSASAGHVGFISSVSSTRIGMVGGNQSNAITNATFPRSKFIAFRWPTTFPVKAYPTFTGAAIDGGGIVSTR